MRSGTFTLSLDCEGLWGMADSAAVFADGKINARSLDDAYEFISNELDRNQIRCTAAFVTCFAASYDAVRAQIDKFDALADLVPDWFRNLRPRIRDGGPEAINGLEGHRYWERLARSGHEMAWHGTTHMPLHSTTSRAAVTQELELTASLAEGLGGVGTTVIFPRNLIGHLDLLRSAGFKCYRDSMEPTLARRVGGLLREWAIWDRGDDHLPHEKDGWRVSPAGHFLNWPSGARKLVPIDVTVRRWRSMLRSAAETGRNVHMWFHPHNLITAPRMREALSQVLEAVAEFEKLGDLKCLSIAEANDRFDQST